jgi:hypothetical protein
MQVQVVCRYVLIICFRCLHVCIAAATITSSACACNLQHILVAHSSIKASTVEASDLRLTCYWRYVLFCISVDANAVIVCNAFSRSSDCLDKRYLIAIVVVCVSNTSMMLQRRWHAVAWKHCISVYVSIL